MYKIWAELKYLQSTLSLAIIYIAIVIGYAYNDYTSSSMSMSAVYVWLCIHDFAMSKQCDMNKILRRCYVAEHFTLKCTERM